jgi:outer membrane protein assembly factor BamB
MRAYQPLLLIGLFACESGAASTPGKKISSPAFEIDARARVVRRDPGGTIAWATPLDEKLGGLLWDSKRVYVRHDGGVTALAAQTGTILWHAPGRDNSLGLRGDLLLGTRKGWVIGRAVLTGAEVLKVRLPKGVVAGLPQGDDWVYLSGKDVVRLAPGHKPRWRTPLGERGGFGAGGLAEVAGDLVVFQYHSFSDSGVDVLRLNAVTGRRVWRASCPPLGVDHSEYYHHAEVTVEGERLRVTSEGASGTFVEWLDLRTGKRLKRTVSKK